ncbi:MAG: GlsB/YeaQ/YmgE family stress response membrane protein [Caldiserica bacterium]|jgi:uncharacterized membrane protein YeaQ/YmgE (transglycosylase-associated protein family)|nr:GlsB/YeaQ/YmgE family stress response membrane protein [Caldisericota bacterium]
MPSWFWWIVIGIAAGWLAGQVMKGSGYGLLGDLIIGAIGGYIGGWLFGKLGIAAGSGPVGAIITATIGAILLIIVLRALRGGRR